LPEGHTLHRLADELRTVYGGLAVASSSPQGRFAAEAARIDGQVLEGAEAWGKHVFVSFVGVPEQVHVHLGLYGTFVVASGAGLPVVGQVRWRMEAGSTADLRGPNACELLTPPEVDARIARLGPDPLRLDADPDRAWRRIHRSSMPIASLLMDQAVLAGVGNVYRAEVLFRNEVAPMTAGRRITRKRWDAMWSDLVGLMRDGVRTGRIDTVRPEHEPEAMGRAPRADDHGGEVYVYRRDGQACLVCDTPVRRRVLAGRNLFWCPTCQHRG
jgi:formamidopyrimidine-DNA glycosylase